MGPFNVHLETPSLFEEYPHILGQYRNFNNHQQPLLFQNMTEALQKLKKPRLWIKFQVSCQQTGYKVCEENVTFVKKTFLWVL